MSNPHPSTGFHKRPQDINRKGRPIKGQTLTDVAKKYLDEKYGKDGKLTRKELFIARCVNLAIKGDHAFARLIWNYIDGMPMQKTEISTPNDHPFELIINDKRRKKDG